MWDPKIESSGKSSSGAEIQNNKKVVIDECTDSGFMSSGLLSSSDIHEHLGEDQIREATEQPLVASLQKPTEDNSSAAAAKKDQSSSSPSETSDNNKKQIESYQDSGLVDDSEIQSLTQELKTMLLDRGIDDNLAEWYCNLKMNSEPSVSSGQINNLGKNSPSPTSSLSSGRLNISEQQPPGSKKVKQANTTGKGTIQIPAEEQLWEACYMQDANGDTYMHLAVAQGAEDIVNDLIRVTPHPCLFDIQNDLFQSPLHLAVLVGHAKIVRSLLLAGAETSIRDRFGNTPLHLACNRADLECVRMLTERITASEETSRTTTTTTKTLTRHQILYPNLEAHNYDGERCVHVAVLRKSEAVLRQLIRQGADVNAREGKAGRTPLHLAIEMEQLNLVKVLLEECNGSGAQASRLDLEQKMYRGCTAYQLACYNDDHAIASLLASKGCEQLMVESSSSEDSDDSELDESEMVEMFASHSFFKHQSPLLNAVCSH